MALVITLFLPATILAQGAGVDAKQTNIVRPKSGSEQLPAFLYGDRIEGIANKESTVEGNAELRRGDVSIRADSLKYFSETEDVDARGNVRFERAGSVITGPALRYRVNDATGTFEKPDYSLAPIAKPDQPSVSGRGNAEALEFLGEHKYRIKDGFFTTCKPGDDDWLIKAGEIDLDFTREIGTARDGKVVFKGVPLIAAPDFDFSLNNKRKSGLLPPLTGSTSSSGLELSVPYYFNLAPNYDMTVTPRYMEKRGLLIGEQFRYLGQHFNGELRAEVLPDDRVADQNRSAVSLVHNYNLDGRILGGLNLNKVSDDNYFRDLASRINITSQVTLPREGFLTYNGAWWGPGSYSATARVQRFQVLQDPLNPISIPYERRPQLTLSAFRQDAGGIDFGTSAEFVDFTHPTQVTGNRATIYPSLSLPLVAPSAFFTPKFGVNATHYSLEQNTAGMPDTINRTLPIFSLDSGLVFEREAKLYGQSVTQTLEPRAYYVYIPFRDQNQIPLFDTATADFNYAQIFSENSFAGGDRINDANQLTLALTSRMLQPSTGQEVLRATFGQRYYFKDQQVTLNPTDVPRTYPNSDWLTALSGRVASNWTAEAASEYDPRDRRSERLSFSTRYQPGPLKTFNFSYRYQRDQIKQIDTSGQWPLGGRWFGVGRFNYSLPDSRIVESIAGLELRADCWVSRFVLQRFAVTAGSSTTAFFLQLELNGVSRIGSNPLEALKRNVPGYQRFDAPPADGAPARPFDFND